MARRRKERFTLRFLITVINDVSPFGRFQVTTRGRLEIINPKEPIVASGTLLDTIIGGRATRRQFVVEIGIGSLIVAAYFSKASPRHISSSPVLFHR